MGIEPYHLTLNGRLLPSQLTSRCQFSDMAVVCGCRSSQCTNGDLHPDFWIRGGFHRISDLNRPMTRVLSITLPVHGGNARTRTLTTGLKVRCAVTNTSLPKYLLPDSDREPLD